MLAILSVLLAVGSVSPADAQEPTLANIFTRLGFTNIIEVPFETFPAGTYDLRLLAEFSSLSKQNKISTYPLDLSTLQVLITGSQARFGFTHPPISQRFVAESPFGLALDTPSDRFFTERTRNIDGMAHARIFHDLNAPESFLIGFEDSVDQDFQDVVLKLTVQQVPTQVPITFTRNLSNGKSVVYKANMGAGTRSIDATVEATLMLEGKVLLNIATLQTRQRSAATYIVNFGPAFQGIEKGRFTWDGELLHGIIDGRPIVPVPMGLFASTNAITFTDGKPVRVKGNSETAEALEGLTVIQNALAEEMPPQLLAATTDPKVICMRRACALCSPPPYQCGPTPQGILSCQGRPDCESCVADEYNDCCKGGQCELAEMMWEIGSNFIPVFGNVISTTKTILDATTLPRDPYSRLPPDPFKMECMLRREAADNMCRAVDAQSYYRPEKQFFCDESTGETIYECDTCKINLLSAEQQCEQITGSKALNCENTENCSALCTCAFID